MSKAASQSYQRLALERALEKYPVDAPIRALCSDPAVAEALAKHETADQIALVAQSQYRLWGRIGLVTSLFAGIFGGVLLAPDSIPRNFASTRALTNLV